MPTPPSRVSPSPKSTHTAPTPDSNNSLTDAIFGSNAMPDPSVWSEQQQQQFMQALMAGGPLSRSPESLPGLTPTDVDPNLPPMDNPFAAMLFPQGGGGFPPAAGKFPAGTGTAQPPTRLQKLMPFVHLTTMWCLLAYFVLYKEPQIYGEVGGNVEGAGLWRRWAELGRSSPVGDAAQLFKVQIIVSSIYLGIFMSN